MKKIKDSLLTVRVNEQELNVTRDRCAAVDLTVSSLIHYVMAEVNSGRMVLDHDTVKNTIKK